MVRAIVLPPGHGKSFMTGLGLPTSLREADKIYDCKETEELALLRLSAKRHADWRLYDNLLCHELHIRTEETDIIMIATDTLAIRLGIEIIGYFPLTLETWCENMAERCRPISKHINVYVDCFKKSGGKTYTRESLYDTIRALA